MRAFVVGGRARVTSDNAKLKPWRSVVSMEARQAMDAASESLIQGPCSVHAFFRLQLPASAPKRRRILPDKQPDLDKLARGLFDALTGVVWDDDKRVVSLTTTKRYTEPGEQPGVLVTVRPVSP